ncbi:MAG: hypothetical protein VXV71_03360, partial [Candidatus Thermoplasmatota archaeon]|nr:hypothetical protein [Candidatus Thermoplasmatota archaeon]
MAVSNRNKSDFAKADAKKNRNVTSAIVTAKELTRREGCLNLGARINTMLCPVSSVWSCREMLDASNAGLIKTG